MIGKCCRDPTYTDPWPTNQLGQWVPGAFGDTGEYRPKPAQQGRGGPSGPRGPNRRDGPNTAGSVNTPIYANNPNKLVPVSPVSPNKVPAYPGIPLLPLPNQQQQQQPDQTYTTGALILDSKINAASGSCGVRKVL